MSTATTAPILPQICFSKVSNNKKNNIDNNAMILKNVAALFKNKSHLTEIDFHAVTNICSLPRYMNLALFRAIDDQHDEVTLDQFKKSWPFLLKNNDHDYKDDLDAAIYYILKKPDINCLTPDDFMPVLENIVLNHPALQFLENNTQFQERYIEAVTCRIFYEASCPTGKLSLVQFRKSGFANTLKSLDPYVDLYNTQDIFSYKQFYVLYCKMWSLDMDHNLRLSEEDLNCYNMGALNALALERVIKMGCIPAFRSSGRHYTVDATGNDDINDVSSTPSSSAPVFNYFDFLWFFLSEVDKSTPMAIEYWFRCLDMDGDGVISSYELEKFWKIQDLKQRCYSRSIPFQNIMRQMNDLIRPQTPGQFVLKDLKRNGYLAERFFDTFINYDTFSVHESHQQASVREQQEFELKQRKEEYARLSNGAKKCQQQPAHAIIADDLGNPALCKWNDYADLEYDRIMNDEVYTSYETYEFDINQQQEHQATSNHCNFFEEQEENTSDDDEESIIFRTTYVSESTTATDDFAIDSVKGISVKVDAIDSNITISSSNDFSNDDGKEDENGPNDASSYSSSSSTCCSFESSANNEEDEADVTTADGDTESVDMATKTQHQAEIVYNDDGSNSSDEPAYDSDSLGAEDTCIESPSKDASPQDDANNDNHALSYLQHPTTIISSA